MSIYLHWLLPNSPWVLAAIGREKTVRTFLSTEEGHRSAEEFVLRHAGEEIRVLAGRARTILSSVPTKQHVLDICAVGVRTSPAHMASIRGLQNAPAILFEYRGDLIAAWRFAKPINPDDAEKAESFLAERFKGKRLNFFIPVPVGISVINFDRRYIDPKNIESQLKSVVAALEDDEEFSADASPKQKSWVIEPIVQRKRITLLSGEPGEGKSQIALDFAMRVSLGIGLPKQPAPEIGGTIVSEMEDDWFEDVVPRLMALKANRKLIKGMRIANLHTEKGIAKLEAARQKFVAEKGVPLVLLILSPYMACFGGGSNQEAHMRDKMFHISQWASEKNVAILGVAHLDAEGNRVAGPQTHRRLARGSWVVARDGEQRFLTIDKVNNTKGGVSFPYRIDTVWLKKSAPDGSDIETSKIVWEDIPNFKPRETPFDMAANIEPKLPVRKYSETTLKYVSALKDIFTPGGQPIKGVEVRRALASRDLSWGRPVYDAAVDALGIDIGDRNGITESKPWTPPSQWPKAFS